MNDLTKAAYFRLGDPGYLRLSGPDRIPFLQRQTTNDIRKLTPGNPLITVLTSPAGRILDVLWVIDEGEDRLGLLTLPGQDVQTADFLKSRIFFMDKVSLDHESGKYALINLFAHPEKGILQLLGIRAENSPHSMLGAFLGGASTRVLNHPEMGWRLLVPIEQEQDLIAFLEDQQFQSLSENEYEVLRVEYGIPAAGKELVEAYTPLEVGFEWAISDSKGCYTGQEVIARQLNYDKITRQLIGLRLNGKPQIGDQLNIQANNQSQGKITSFVTSPRFGEIALAVVKRPYHHPGNRLLVNKEDMIIEAVTTGLPFE